MSEPKLYLVTLRLYDDTFYRAAMAETVLDAPEMRLLRELARSKGLCIDVERLDTIKDMERFLEQLAP